MDRLTCTVKELWGKYGRGEVKHREGLCLDAGHIRIVLSRDCRLHRALFPRHRALVAWVVLARPRPRAAEVFGEAVDDELIDLLAKDSRRALGRHPAHISSALRARRTALEGRREAPLTEDVLAWGLDGVEPGLEANAAEHVARGLVNVLEVGDGLHFFFFFSETT